MFTASGRWADLCRWLGTFSFRQRMTVQTLLATFTFEYPILRFLSTPKLGVPIQCNINTR